MFSYNVTSTNLAHSSINFLLAFWTSNLSLSIISWIAPLKEVSESLSLGLTKSGNASSSILIPYSDKSSSDIFISVFDIHFQCNILLSNTSLESIDNHNASTIVILPISLLYHQVSQAYVSLLK